MAKKRKKLGEILYRKKIVDKPTLIKAMKKSKASKMRLGETLVEMGKLTEDKLTQALAKQFGFQYIDLDNQEISQTTMELIPDELVRKHFILPLEKEDGVMKVIVSDPQNIDLIDMLRFRLNCEIECCLATPSKIKSRIHGKMDEVRSSIDATTAELERQGHDLREEIRLAEEASDSDDDGPIIRLVNMLIDEATNTFK